MILKKLKPKSSSSLIPCSYISWSLSITNISFVSAVKVECSQELLSTTLKTAYKLIWNLAIIEWKIQVNFGKILFWVQDIRFCVETLVSLFYRFSVIFQRVDICTNVMLKFWGKQKYLDLCLAQTTLILPFMSTRKQM